MSFNYDKYIQDLYQVLQLEKIAQKEKYGLKIDQQNLKELKKSGLVLHPLKVQNKSFLSDETPAVHFQILFDGASNLFKPGTPVRCFFEQNLVDAQVVEMQEKTIIVALKSESFPDWIEERGVGLALVPDEHTFDLMEAALDQLKANNNPCLKAHISSLNRGVGSLTEVTQIYQNEQLNTSQNQAVNAILQNEGIQIVHGPPGTGKTTTLSHAIQALVKSGKRILVAAPSNTAVDHFAKVLVKKGVKVLRVGNHIKIDDAILDFTVDGYLSKSTELKQIKSYQKQIDDLRKKAGQFKRVFDKTAREERNACYQEIKALRSEIKALRKFAIDKVKSQCEVILGTPVGLRDELGVNYQADYLFIDEAGQCHDALAWMLAIFANNWILAGDIHQLPPTYLATKNLKNPAASSILHNMQQWIAKVYFLDTQYRMEPRIATFSNRYFYDNRLQHFKPNSDVESVLFYDTAGMGKDEQQFEESGSRYNDGEVDLIQTFLEMPENESYEWVIISPYQAQVELLKSTLGTKFRISTIDSFQGQEAQGVILSLVRSNENQEIGFLKDYRRMNVAMTRAQDRLVIFADSATIGTDDFYADFLDYCEEIGVYRSGFEL
jgi:ATP-dependent RNA/DNA helicase IGHMBP2